MLKVIAALEAAFLCLLFGLFTVPAFADWSAMNEEINATNFIVADQCSGTLISLKYRLVLTNNHCLEGFVDTVEKDETGPNGKVESVKREVFKTMPLVQKVYKDFEEVGSATYQAEILFHVPHVDLAVLQIKADTIPQTIYAHILPPEKKVMRGDKVFVVGNPYMLDANLTEGFVSSVNRRLKIEDGDEMPFLGVDAGVNPGNSGGALYNADGELIGVPAAGVRGATGLGFAIPYTQIRKVLADNCYESVWNEKAPDHDACEKTKLDKENEIRVKAGLPPKDAPAKDDRYVGDAAGGAIKADSMKMKHAPLWLPPALEVIESLLR